MIDFEKLVVYGKAKEFCLKVQDIILEHTRIDRTLKDQLRRCSLSISLNIARVCSRFSKADRRNFFVIVRGSVFEVIAILDILKPEIIELQILSEYKLKAEEILKILFALIRQLEKKSCVSASLRLNLCFRNRTHES